MIEGSHKLPGMSCSGRSMEAIDEVSCCSATRICQVKIYHHDLQKKKTISFYFPEERQNQIKGASGHARSPQSRGWYHVT